VDKDVGESDAWPAVRAADILLATPTWMGHMSSVASRVMERLDAEQSDTLPAVLTPSGVPQRLAKGSSARNGVLVAVIAPRRAGLHRRGPHVSWLPAVRAEQTC
jgi:multimeric flavodoxin WrbA